MKKCLAAILIACALFSGCKSETEYGKCIAIDDNQDPKLEYKVSVRNVVIGAIFFETLVVPVVILFSEFECPVARK